MLEGFGCEPTEGFADGNGTSASGFLGDGNKRGVRKYGEMGEG